MNANRYIMELLDGLALRFFLLVVILLLLLLASVVLSLVTIVGVVILTKVGRGHGILVRILIPRVVAVGLGFEEPLGIWHLRH